MLTIEPTGAVPGGTVRGPDLARPLDESDVRRILLALGCRCTALITSRYWTRWRDRKAL